MEVKQNFLNNVQNHVMYVKKNEGLYRHLNFKSPANNHAHFDIITWPNHLCITGDYGTFTFSRIEDMFKFFNNPNGKLEINECYWAEKCISASREEIEKFSTDVCAQTIQEHFEQYISDIELEEHQIANIKDDVESLISEVQQNEWHAVTAINNFHSHYAPNLLEDFWGNSCKEYTYHFKWCLYAIVWGIQNYDKPNTPVTVIKHQQYGPSLNAVISKSGRAF